jgi:hypothetical protein
MRRHYDTRTVQVSGKVQLINGKELLTARMHARGHVKATRYWSEIVVLQWGWVVEISGRIAGFAHSLEKSEANLRDISIHRLCSAKV